jgi:hypothetical protein
MLSRAITRGLFSTPSPNGDEFDSLGELSCQRSHHAGSPGSPLPCLVTLIGPAIEPPLRRSVGRPSRPTALARIDVCWRSTNSRSTNCRCCTNWRRLSATRRPLKRSLAHRPQRQLSLGELHCGKAPSGGTYVNSRTLRAIDRQAWDIFASSCGMRGVSGLACPKCRITTVSLAARSRG